ncbi:hypothetical protein CDL12_12981 [Handroanthus impetiginosus]|uniref:BHLH domain-containing protein n=1 Tax=Handroanthus impetiginosus TaxID=429701 RepID=A0A2G9HA42_9LAMI|nr:hypothetical protein CDL12_12981 [Handroanthus impetiginosus]
MFSPETVSNLNNQIAFKNVSAEGEFFKSREFMGSDFSQNQNQNSRLARYRSAPSSFLEALLDSAADNSSSGDECEAFFSALMDGPNQKNSDNQMQYSTKQEGGVEMEPRPVQNGFTNGHVTGHENVVNRSYTAGVENQVHRNCSNLVRQTSSPAGFFNGFGVMGEVENYGVHNHAEASSSSSGLSNHMNFSSGLSYSPKFMASIPENGNESMGQNHQFLNGNNGANGRKHEAAFPHDSWNESPFNGLKRNRGGDPKMFSNFNGLENQNGESRKRSTGLVSHLSLPKTSAETAAVENFLQIQQEGMVPCQMRAKRGFATHPRSIAERMRRTRISEKMKKLQDLFPNMDKQTNTADMLDLAVEYIKDLQKQVQRLTNTREKCVCSNKPKQTSP